MTYSPVSEYLLIVSKITLLKCCKSPSIKPIAANAHFILVTCPDYNDLLFQALQLHNLVIDLMHLIYNNLFIIFIPLHTASIACSTATNKLFESFTFKLFLHSGASPSSAQYSSMDFIFESSSLKNDVT